MFDIVTQFSFTARFEGGGYIGTVKLGIDGAVQLTDKSDTFSLAVVTDWFDSVLAALDCYTWVFGEGLLSPGELFSKSTIYSTSTV